MFEKFTDQARRVIVLAQEEARMLDHGYIGTEHLLLGLVREDEGVVPDVLGSLGFALEDVRSQVAAVIGHGSDPPSGHIPFTPRATRVLELALTEAQQLNLFRVGAEHLLLGLAREGEGVAGRVLDRLGADLDAVRQQVVRLMSAERGRHTDVAGGGQGRREIDHLRTEVARLRRLLADHGIDADAAGDNSG